jgi:AbiU2
LPCYVDRQLFRVVRDHKRRREAIHIRRAGRTIVYEPGPADFRRLRADVARQRRIYEDRYRELRHKVFAHKGLSHPQQITALFARTNIREMQRMLAFLMAPHQALWQLFNNGRKPTLRPGVNQRETISLARS